MFKNNLKRFIGAKSQAVLVKSNELTNDQIEIVNKLLFRLKSVLRAKGQDILLNAPNKKINAISSILYILKSYSTTLSSKRVEFNAFCY